jgi:integrase
VDLDLVDAVPKIPRLEELNTRKGFFEDGQYADVRKHLPDYLRPLCDVAFHTGWRQGELLSRTWADVDLATGWLRLEPHETKNGEGRQFPLIAPVRGAIEVQKARKLELERSEGRIIRQLFFTPAGEPVSRYTLHSAFKRACSKAGHPERLFHDFRRTAVRNSTRAGIPRSVAKTLSAT